MGNRISRKTLVVIVAVFLACASSVTAQRPREWADSKGPFHKTDYTRKAPQYKVDPWWPKELPNNWLLGHIEGVAVDKDDNIWVLHETRSLAADQLGAEQNPPYFTCCVAAPAIIQFDPQGNVLRAWGKPGYVEGWPHVVQGIAVDKDLNVWIGGTSTPGSAFVPAHQAGHQKPHNSEDAWDRQVLKFDRDGKFLMKIGRPSPAPINNQDTTLLGGPSGIKVDDEKNEVYIADGHLNKRVVVYDAKTGAFKRGWGAYGVALGKIDNDPPDEAPPYDPLAAPIRAFRSVTDLGRSREGLIYAADRISNRIQIFDPMGTFLKEFFVAPYTLGQGSAWAAAASRDPGQKYLFVADGASSVIRILDRETGVEIGKIGHKGRNAGEFNQAGSLAFDSKNVLYVGETNFNARVQRFVPIEFP